MRGAVRCCLLLAFAWAAARHVGHWSGPDAPPRASGAGLFGALSFALAAVVDRNRR